MPQWDVSLDREGKHDPCLIPLDYRPVTDAELLEERLQRIEDLLSELVAYVKPHGVLITGKAAETLMATLIEKEG